MALPNLDKAWFFMIGVPLAWAAASLVLFRHPGDEYFRYVLGSAGGVWILFVLPDVSKHSPWLPISVALAGFATMAALGWLELRLGVKRRGWLLVWTATVALTVAAPLLYYRDLASQFARSGALASHGCTAALLACYAATGLSIVFVPLARARPSL